MNSEVVKQVAIVVIGRNEGQRLLDCFQSFLNQSNKMIYVDSGSTDGSVSAAQKLGIEVVSLDMSTPFTAARARNAGFYKALAVYPDVKYIQFIDGDCQVFPDWLPTAASFIAQHDEMAAICGRLKEVSPESSIYNFLCDIEWDTPIGETKACGGIALMRVEALQAVKGFREDLIAGEEPELCVRLRQAGWKIWRLNANMAKHDANITHFKQWWKRSVRAGYAYAEGSSIHGAPPESHWVAETRRGWLWAGIIPVLVVICSFISPLLGLCMVLIYPIQVAKMTITSPLPAKKAFLHALFLMIGKFPELIGQIKYFSNKSTKKRSAIIEYK